MAVSQHRGFRKSLKSALIVQKDFVKITTKATRLTYKAAKAGTS